MFGELTNDPKKWPKIKKGLNWLNMDFRRSQTPQRGRPSSAAASASAMAAAAVTQTGLSFRQRWHHQLTKSFSNSNYMNILLPVRTRYQARRIGGLINQREGRLILFKGPSELGHRHIRQVEPIKEPVPVQSFHEDKADKEAEPWTKSKVFSLRGAFLHNGELHTNFIWQTPEGEVESKKLPLHEVFEYMPTAVLEFLSSECASLEDIYVQLVNRICLLYQQLKAPL